MRTSSRSSSTRGGPRKERKPTVTAATTVVAMTARGWRVAEPMSTGVSTKKTPVPYAPPSQTSATTPAKVPTMSRISANRSRPRAAAKATANSMAAAKSVAAAPTRSPTRKVTGA